MTVQTGTAGGDTMGAGELTLVSTDTNGAQYGESSFRPAFSSDGSALAFTQLRITGWDWYYFSQIKNLTTGEVVAAHPAPPGATIVGEVYGAVLSPDFTKIVSWGSASGMSPDGGNGRYDVFVTDLTTGTVVVASKNALGQSANQASNNAVMLPDGRVAFETWADNLVAGDTNNETDIFIKDLATGEVICVSTASDGSLRSGRSETPVFSADGAVVVFSSGARLVAEDTNNTFDIYVKNLATGQTTLVSTGLDGAASGVVQSNRPAISADGTKVLFRSDASNLVDGDTNGRADLFLKDLVTGTVTRVNVAADGAQEDGWSGDTFALSPDGTKIAWSSNSTNLAPGVLGAGNGDLFLKDLLTGEVVRVSAKPSGEGGDGYSFDPVFSPDGEWLAFSSYADDLTPDDNNGGMYVFADVFLYRVRPVAHSFDGGAGDDVISGGRGADRLKGGLGADQLTGGGGDDTYIVDNLGDLVIELAGGGVDLVHSTISWTLGDHLENLTLAGALALEGVGNGLGNAITGNDFANRLVGLGGDDALLGAGRNDVLEGGDGDDRLDGGLHNDVLNGDAGDDLLLGGAGADTLDGGQGADDMRGGAGADLYRVDDLADTVTETDAGPLGGVDHVRASVGFTLGQNIENLTLEGLGDIDGTGNALRNVIVGNAGANAISGGGERDILSGGEGDDRLAGDDGVDLLSGDEGDDHLLGGEGIDTLNGGAGDDLLEGGPGADRLTGGGGADRFLFSAQDVGPTVQRDQILDLDFGEGDLIDLAAIDANAGLAGDQAFVWAARFSRSAGQATLTHANGVTTLLLDVDGDGLADFRIAITGDHAATRGNLYEGLGDADGGWVM